MPAVLRLSRLSRAAAASSRRLASSWLKPFEIPAKLGPVRLRPDPVPLHAGIVIASSDEAISRAQSLHPQAELIAAGSARREYEVLLATCNGERFLAEQIASILEQTVLPQRLLIADDNSSDRTGDLIREWQQQSPVPMEVLPAAVADRLGSSRNFERLLQASQAPYVMLADQDDIWDRDKAERLLHQIARLEHRWGTHKPLLVHGDLRLIDAEGHRFAASFHRCQGLNPERCSTLEIGLQNVVTGCASLLNRACVRQALPFPDQVVLHDWWLALVAAETGAIAYLPEACVSYRQHGSNVVGAVGWRRQLMGRLRQVGTSANRQVSAQQLISPGLLQLSACLDRFGSANRLSRLEGLWSSRPWIRLQTAWRLGLRKHGLWRTLGFYAALWIAQPWKH